MKINNSINLAPRPRVAERKAINGSDHVRKEKSLTKFQEKLDPMTTANCQNEVIEKQIESFTTTTQNAVAHLRKVNQSSPNHREREILGDVIALKEIDST